MSDTPIVLGHPATKEWCQAVDAHHAATESLLANASAEVKRLTELSDATREWFAYLDRTEESDEGRVFHPVSFGCCRAMWVDRINAIMADMKRLSRATGESQPPVETRPIPLITP